MAINLKTVAQFAKMFAGKGAGVATQKLVRMRLHI